MRKSIPALIAFVLFISLSMLGLWSSALALDSGPEPGDIVSLGKVIFFDTDLSRPRGQSCASCHDPAAGFADPNHLAVSTGAIPNRVGNRNAQSISYAMYSPELYFDPTTTPAIPEGKYHGGLFWDGRANTLEDQAKQPFLNPLEMHNPNKITVVQSVRRAEYAGLFKEVFGPFSLRDVEQAYEYIAQALADYMRSPEVNPFTSKYDYWKKGQAEYTESELRGYQLFTGTGAKCFNCHSEPYFTNFGHQNLGTPRNPDLPYYFLPPSLNPDGVDYIDQGLGDFLRSAGYPEEQAVKEDGKFKIPSLRNCALTAPYSHNGYHETLRDLVVFNNTRDLPEANWPAPEVPETVHRHPMAMPGTLGRLGLNDQQIDDIVAFLHTLTDGYVPLPAGPADLAAVAVNANQVDLTWTDNAVNEAGFRIERATVIDEIPGPFAAIGTADMDATTFSDGTVAPDTTYAYRVFAFNEAGDSLPADIAMVTTPLPLLAAPADLAGVAVRIKGDPRNDKGTLTWTDNSDNETSFQVQCSLSTKFSNPMNFFTGPNRTSLTQVVSRQFDFYCRVRARNAVDNSAWSNVVFVTTP
jgi:cytochrome c peroxidase